MGLNVLAPVLMCAALCLAAAGWAQEGPPGLTVIRPVVVDPDATGYGTFQSHNQKVVSNRRGVFMTHIRTRNEPYTAQQWRLSRSTDGGQSFTDDDAFGVEHDGLPESELLDGAGHRVHRHVVIAGVLLVGPDVIGSTLFDLHRLISLFHAKLVLISHRKMRGSEERGGL